MANPFFEEMIRNGAKRLAKRHIYEALNSSFFDYEACKSEYENNFWKRKSYNFLFDNAYSNQWHQVGADDALSGRRRLDEFPLFDGYRIGWSLQIIAMTRSGWINPNLIEKYGIKNYVCDDFSGHVRAIQCDVSNLDFDYKLPSATNRFVNQ